VKVEPRLETRTRSVTALTVKLFADGADAAEMRELYRNPLIRGFTTNPTLMRKAGVTAYQAFARDILQAIPDRPISFEVFSDEFVEMERQALEISQWGPNVYVKIPITNTRGESSFGLARRLADRAVKVNVTAMLSLDQLISCQRWRVPHPHTCRYSQDALRTRVETPCR
jgi:transaldolase